MQHQASLTTPEENLTDVTVAIINRAGAVVVAPTPAPLVAGTTDCYRVVLTVPDSLGSGRERWASASAGFSDFDSDPIIFKVPTVDIGDSLAPIQETLADILADTDYIDTTLRASVPEDAPWTPSPSPPPPLGTGRLDFFARDFNVTDGVEMEFVVAMEETRIVIIEGAMERDQSQKFATVNGHATRDFYTSEALEAANYNPHYIITCPIRKFKRRVWIPAGTSNALKDLPDVPVLPAS